jgi:hypothetical protein
VLQKESFVFLEKEGVVCCIRKRRRGLLYYRNRAWFVLLEKERVICCVRGRCCGRLCIEKDGVVGCVGERGSDFCVKEGLVCCV